MGFYRECHGNGAKVRHSAADRAHNKLACGNVRLQPLVTRAELVVADEVEDSLAKTRAAHGSEAARQAASQFAAEVAEGRASYGGMLGRVWKEAQRTLSEVEASEDMPVAKRIAALRDLGKLMPMLAKAEAIHRARIGGVAIEDMSDAQLERELRHVKRKNPRKPPKAG